MLVMKMTEKTLQDRKKELKIKFVLSYFVRILISRGVPLIAIGNIYGIVYTQDEQTKFTGMFMIALIIIAWTFYKDVSDMIIKFADEKVKNSAPELKWSIVFLILLLFIQVAKTGLGNIELVILWAFIASAIATVPATYHNNIAYKLTKLKEEETKQKESL